MTGKQPPRLATWILMLTVGENEALMGDLAEEYARRQSRVWYWRQAFHALLVGMWRPAMLVVLVALLYAAGSWIAIPGARGVLDALVAQSAASIPGPQRLFTVFLLGGGEMSWGTVFTLGINPYISAAFLVQVVMLLWRLLNRNSDRRRLPIVAITWTVALVLCVTQAAGFAMFLERVSAVSQMPVVDTPGWVFRVTAIVALTAGTLALMFISDQISRHHMGNGMLIVFLAASASSIPGLLSLLLGGAVDPVALLSVLMVNVLIASAISYGYQRAIAREALA